MSDADKQAKIAAIDQQLADLAHYQELLKQFN